MPSEQIFSDINHEEKKLIFNEMMMMSSFLAHLTQRVM
jgi:hypothetical protein